MPLSNEQMKRYARHIVLREIGVAGQEKLLSAKVMVVGLGGLGSASIPYLAAAGVGTLGLVDNDKVDLSNLQRQIVHSSRNVGRSKAVSAKERVRDINPEVRVVDYDTRLTRENAENLIREYDIIVDGTDNFSARYALNDACAALKKPFVYGTIFKFEGQASVFKSPEGPCYRCLYPEEPPPGIIPTSVEAGVMGVLPGVIGLIQATETVKWIVGQGKPLIGRLLLYQALEMRFREVQIHKDAGCLTCGHHKNSRA